MPTSMERLGEIFIVRRSRLQRLLDKILRRYTIQIVTYSWRLRSTGNGEVVAVAGKSFTNQEAAAKAFATEFPAYEYIYAEC
jgi:hypothetical protein